MSYLASRYIYLASIIPEGGPTHDNKVLEDLTMSSEHCLCFHKSWNEKVSINNPVSKLFNPMPSVKPFYKNMLPSPTKPCKGRLCRVFPTGFRCTSMMDV